MRRGKGRKRQTDREREGQRKSDSVGGIETDKAQMVKENDDEKEKEREE